MMKVVYVEVDRCLACLNCVRACFFRQHENLHGAVANILVHVDLDHRRIVAATCLQCEDAPCMEACPTGALYRDPETRAVVVDKQACVGCAMCVVACPFGNVQLDAIRRVATKCDLCGGDPKCVQVCMAKALHFASVDELDRLRRQNRDRKLAVRALADDSGSKAAS